MPTTSPVRRVPGRLTAPEPGWTTSADVVVIGSGIAGLTAALRLKDALGPGEKVLVVTKDVLSAGSTRWAQGGIAAALGPEDTPEEHERDTLVAGAGGCDLEAVRALVTEGPEAVHELIGLGAQFDLDPQGELSPAATRPARRSSARWSLPWSGPPRSRWSSTRWPSTCCSPPTAGSRA